MRTSIMFLLLVAWGSASAQDRAISIPDYLSAKCHDLAVVTYWSATAHLSRADKESASQAIKEAEEANDLRPALDAAIIQKAEGNGFSSHGNAGPGLSNLHDARGDAIVAAMETYEQCIEGELLGSDNKERERWWVR